MYAPGARGDALCTNTRMKKVMAHRMNCSGQVFHCRPLRWPCSVAPSAPRLSARCTFISLATLQVLNVTNLSQHGELDDLAALQKEEKNGTQLRMLATPSKHKPSTQPGVLHGLCGAVVDAMRSFVGEEHESAAMAASTPMHLRYSRSIKPSAAHTAVQVCCGHDGTYSMHLTCAGPGCR